MVNYGFVKSELNGTEYQFNVDNAKSLNIPTHLTYENVLPKVLDQGNKPICVPCSCSAYVNWKINVNDNTMKDDNEISLLEIYEQRENKFTDGMQFKEALHYLYKHGVQTEEGVIKINEYSMIKSVELLKYALVMNGPCIGGLMVYSNASDKFWKPYGKPMGGHAIAIIGYNENGFLIRNSWGESFGKKGIVTLDYKDFDKFIELWTMC